MDKAKILEYFKNKEDYKHLLDTDLEIIYDRAKYAILNALFPFNDSITEVPERYSTKLIDAMEEILVRSNMANATTYKENGVEFQWDSSTLQCLKDLIATAGVY